MANDVRWEAVALKADFVHLDRLPQMPVRVRHVNVTMPLRCLTSVLGGRLSTEEREQQRISPHGTEDATEDG
jgi:hypothetical protein